MRRITVFGLILFVLPSFSSAQYRATARLDSTSILIGDQVHLKIEVRLPSPARLQAIRIDTLNTVTGLERLNATLVDSLQMGASTNYTQAFTITSFDSGYFRFPPIPIRLIDGGVPVEILTNDLALQVRTLPVEPDSTQLQPIKDIIREPLQIVDFWWLGLLGLLLVAGYILYRYLRGRREINIPVEVIEAQRPAHEIALEKLGALKAAGYLGQGAFKEYQTELTFILRMYLFMRFGFNALEATSEEIEAEMQAWEIDLNWKEELVYMLKRADLVKFAKGNLPISEHEAGLERVVRFVQDYG